MPSAPEPSALPHAPASPPKPAAGVFWHRHPLRWGWALLAVLFGFAAFWGSRSFGLQDNNEGLYAEVAREMAAGGGWIIPHLNGVPYLEKPPLLYWVLGGLIKVFGGAEWVVRLPSILFFAGTLGAIFWLGRLARRPREALLAAFILCSAGGFVAMNRQLLFDVPLTCALAWSSAAIYGWLTRRQPRYLLLFYALLALGVMTKGLVMLVLGGGIALVAVAWDTRSWRETVGVFHAPGLLLFFALAVPWHILAALREPNFLHFYFINEHVLRFLDLRVPRDYYTGPPYYYLERLPMYLGLWVFFLPLLWPQFVPATAPVRPTPRDAGRALPRLLVAWAAVTLVFFSISKAKANYYYLTGIPPLAFWLACAWPRPAAASGGRKRIAIGAYLAAAVVLVVLIVLPSAMRRDADLRHVVFASPVLVVSSLVLMVALALIAGVSAGRGATRTAFVLMVIGGILPLLPAPWLLRAREVYLSQRPLAEFIHRAGRDRPIVLYRDYEKLSSLTYYAGHPLPVLDSTSDDLYFAQHHGYNPGVFLDDGAFLRLAAAHKVWLVARLHEARAAEQAYAPAGFRIVQRFGASVLLGN